MTNNYHVTPLTSIAATPHAPTRENYNLNGPNTFKYVFDAVDPIGPLNSPPAAGAGSSLGIGSSMSSMSSSSASASQLMAPLLTPIAPISSPIAPLLTTPPQASQLPLPLPPLAGATTQTAMAAGAAAISLPGSMVAPMPQLTPTPMLTPPKASPTMIGPVIKPLKTEKSHTLEKQDSW